MILEDEVKKYLWLEKTLTRRVKLKRIDYDLSKYRLGYFEKEKENAMLDLERQITTDLANEKTNLEDQLKSIIIKRKELEEKLEKKK